MKEEVFEPTMKVREFYKYISMGTNLKIKSGYNGKILCNNYTPRMHDKKYGDRVIKTIWSEIKTFGNGFDSLAKPILVCYVDGEIEYLESMEELESQE